MDRLRPRRREVFSGFTNTETEKLEKLLEKSGEETCSKEFCRKIAISFNRSAGRAGKPLIKWMEVQSWFEKRQHNQPKVIFAPNSGKNEPEIPANCPTDKTNENSQTPKGQKIADLSELEFEAKSSKDGAWYDVDMFLGHRFLDSGEAEVLVRFIGFGAEEDEWINVKKGIRQRSVPLENSECDKVKLGDLVLCFQEKRDQAIYHDAHVIGIQRRMHDIRGCRCLFLIRYNHDNTEARVHDSWHSSSVSQQLCTFVFFVIFILLIISFGQERVRLRRLCWTFT